MMPNDITVVNLVLLEVSSMSCLIPSDGPAESFNMLSVWLVQNATLDRHISMITV